MRVEEVRTLAELRAFVHHTLCDRENLLSEQFPLRETQLTRGGRICGLEFNVHGPRSIRLNAIWAADHNQLYCYGADGERFLKVRLSHRLELEQTAAA